MTIKTEHFRWTHGTPRGPGSWAFQIKTKEGSETYWHTGMYSDAKKAAIKYFTEHYGKHCTITLLT